MFALLFLGHMINQNDLTKNSDILDENSSEVFDIEKIADSFDYPIGKPNAKGYYNAQEFGTNNHLGEDWNGIGGGNTDQGDSIYSVANGYVKYAEDWGSGWGNVIRIVHFLPDDTVVESLYAHCDTILTEPNTWVDRGQLIGTIGTADGIYTAHLHFEMRSDTSLGIGNGYDHDNLGFLSPSSFIESWRESHLN